MPSGDFTHVPLGVNIQGDQTFNRECMATSVCDNASVGNSIAAASQCMFDMSSRLMLAGIVTGGHFCIAYDGCTPHICGFSCSERS